MLLGAVDFNRIIAYVILGIYVALMVAITVISRKKSRSLNDFLFAGKGFGGWITALAYGTTYFSAVVFIGYAGKFGWGYGLAALWIGVGNALIGSLLAWKVFARRTRNMTKGLSVKTMPEFFEKRYQSKNIRLASSIIMFLFLIPYSASVYQGLAYVFETVFGINYVYCVLIMAGLTALYLFFGGYFASALSNFVQAIIMFAGVIVMMILIMHKGGWGDAISRLSEMNLGFFASTSSPTGFFNSNFFNLAIIFLLTSVGICGLPQSVHKFYAVRDDAAIKKATVVSTIFALVIAGGAYFMGAFSRVFDGISPANPDMIMPQLFEATMPAAFMGFIAVLIFAASMSTLAALALAGSSAVAVDFYKGYFYKKASDNSTNKVMKVMCVVYVGISVLLAVVKIEAIVALMGISWGTLAGCFIGPYFYGLYSKKATKAGAWASIIGSLLVTFALFTYFGVTKPNPNFTGALAFIKGGLAKSPLIGVMAMAVSFIITPLVSAFTKKPDAEHVDKVFSFVKKGVVVDSNGCIVSGAGIVESVNAAELAETEMEKE